MNKKRLSWQHIKLLSSDVHFSNVLLQSKMKLANYSLDSYNNCYEHNSDKDYTVSKCKSKSNVSHVHSMSKLFPYDTI